jgi:hypothetical protein
MNTYKNRIESRYMFSTVFIIFFTVILIINIINDLQNNDYKNLMYFAVMFLSCLYIIVFVFYHYNGSIKIMVKKIILNKFICKKRYIFMKY